LELKPWLEVKLRNIPPDVYIDFAEELINKLMIKAPNYSGEEELTNALGLINHYLTSALKCKPTSKRFSALDEKVQSILIEYEL